MSSTGYLQGQMTWILGFVPLYGVIAAIGFSLTCIWAYVEWNKKGLRNWDFIWITVFSTLCGIYGAKIWYIVFDFDHVFGPGGINSVLTFLYSVFVPSTGRTIIGTIIFSAVGIYLYPKFFSPDVNRYVAMDILLPAIALGHAISRWGNFANHNIYGSVITYDQIKWLPLFIVNNMLINGNFRQPLFLYESFADLSTFALIFIVFKTNDFWKEGVAGSSYIMLYGLVRAIIEPFRDPRFIMTTFGIHTSLVSGIIMTIVGLLMMIYFQVKFSKKLNTDRVI